MTLVLLSDLMRSNLQRADGMCRERLPAAADDTSPWPPPCFERAAFALKHSPGQLLLPIAYQLG